MLQKPTFALKQSVAYMKKAGIFLALIFCVFYLHAQTKDKKALFVIVDGIPRDVIKKLNTPSLKAIAKEGAFLDAYVGGEKNGYSQTPTISAVGYNSLLTGTWVNKHNVWDNDIADPDYSYWTIFRYFETQYPEKKTAVFSTWLDNRTKLVGDGLPQTGNLKIDYHYDGMELDTITYPHDKEADYIHRIDEAVVHHAYSFIRKEGPDLSWVYLEFTDDMGHRYGDGKKFYDAIEVMDKQMGRLWDAIQYRRHNFNEDWVIYITTDHGRTADNGKNHGGQSERERNTWIVTNEKKINPWFKTHVPGVVDIMPSIAAHLDIVLPRENAMEVDGVSLTGKIPATNLKATYAAGKITINWTPVDKKAKGKIWLSATNNFKTGGNDSYTQAKEVKIASGKAVIDVSKFPASAFYKIVLESNGYFQNRWIVLK